METLKEQLQRHEKLVESDLLCSFCGKSQDEVKWLITGPGVYICSECVETCNEIIAGLESSGNA